jgi:zinc protease
MSDRSAPRPTLLATGIRALALAAVLAAPAMADNAPSRQQRSPPGQHLQSLAELDGKAPSRRQLTSSTGPPPKAPGCCSSKPASCRCSTCA